MGEKKDDFTTTLKADADSLRRQARDRRIAEPEYPYLLVTAGGQKYKKILLLGNRTVIGRAQTCNVMLDDPCVSAKHAALLRRPQGVFAEDLQSANGTLVNGTAIDAATLLNDGDCLRVGETEFEFRAPGKV